MNTGRTWPFGKASADPTSSRHLPGWFDLQCCSSGMVARHCSSLGQAKFVPSQLFWGLRPLSSVTQSSILSPILLSHVSAFGGLGLVGRSSWELNSAG